MENNSHDHILEELFGSDLLQGNICQRCADITGTNTNTFSSNIPYKILSGGFVAEQIVITSLNGKKVVIKISDNPKLILDAEREIFVQGIAPGVVPSIIEKGEKKFPTGKKYWVIQEYIAGELGADYLKSGSFTEEHKTRLAGTLRKLHQIQQTGESFFGRAGPGVRKKYETFSHYIGHFKLYIGNSHHFPLEIRQKILTSISFFEQKVSGKVHVPCLIHGDFQERNILISDNNTCTLIDFGDIKWSLKEAEFATMLSHISDNRIRTEFSAIINIYERGFGNLDKNLLDLFLLCCGSYKIAQRQEDYTQDGGIWKTIICPILDRIYSESNTRYTDS